MLSIGALSQQTGVKIPTILYNEQLGPIDTPERSQGNQLRYSKTAVLRLTLLSTHVN